MSPSWTSSAVRDTVSAQEGVVSETKVVGAHFADRDTDRALKSSRLIAAIRSLSMALRLLLEFTPMVTR